MNQKQSWNNLVNNILCELTDSLGWGDGIGNMDSGDYIKHLEAFQLAESKIDIIIKQAIQTREREISEEVREVRDNHSGIFTRNVIDKILSIINNKS